jgi:hypothetical protein
VPDLTGWAVEPLTTSMGVATAGVWRARRDPGTSVIVKELRPQDFPGSVQPDHWAYWRREALAYTSGLLPSGPYLVAPRCHGVVDESDRITLYLEDLSGPHADLVSAAYALGSWHGVAVPASEPWLSGNQLAQRIAHTDANGGLDWSEVPVAPALAQRLAAAWDRRHQLLAALDRLPRTLCHADFHRWNLFQNTTGAVVAIDWGGLGLAPLGSDLAYLALSETAPPAELREPYLAGLRDAGWAGEAGQVLLGHCATAGLTGVSRTHWTVTRPNAESIEAYAEWSLSKVEEAVSYAEA